MAGTKQTHDRMTDRRAHAFDQMRPTFRDNNLEPRVALRVFEDFHRKRLGIAIFQANATAQTIERLIFRLAFDLRQVDPLHLVAGMGQVIGQLSIAGENQRPFRVVVESAYRIDPTGRSRKEIGDRLPALGIAQSRHHPGWFVEHQISPLFRERDGLSIHGDQVAIRFDLSPHLGDLEVVHLHATRGDHHLGSATRSHPGAGEKFLKTFFHGAFGASDSATARALLSALVIALSSASNA